MFDPLDDGSSEATGKVLTPTTGEPLLTSRAHSIDHVLAAAQVRFGLGDIDSLPWVRDRVRAFIDAYVERTRCSWDEVVDRISEDPTAMDELIGSLRVGETRFFRDPPQLEAVVRHICATVPTGVTISALSAGCSTGEEAYTMAILLAEKGRRFQILGVDRAADAIEKARQARYTHQAVQEVPKVLLKRHFEDDGLALTVRAPLRAHVMFEARDLLVKVPRGPFHVIFFKNVLIYLAEPIGTQVAASLAEELHEGGLLVPAASEIVRLSHALSPVRLSRSIVAFQRRPT